MACTFCVEGRLEGGGYFVKVQEEETQRIYFRAHLLTISVPVQYEREDKDKLLSKHGIQHFA